MNDQPPKGLVTDSESGLHPAQREIIPISRSIAVLGNYDVLVCGGGPSGCAAAIAAARHGCRTVLIERFGSLGGTTVHQLVSMVLSTNGVDFQGVWHEWARRLSALRAISPLIRKPIKATTGEAWFQASLDPEGVKLVWDEMLADAGVEVLTSTHVCDAIVADQIIQGVIVHTRAGLRAILAGRVIDGTGDAAVCHLAGVEWHRGVEGRLWAQQVSLVYRLGGCSPPGTPGGPRLSGDSTSAYRPELRSRLSLRQIDPLDPFAVSRALRSLRREIRGKVDALSNGSYLVDTATDLGIRTSRIVRGIDIVTDDDVWSLRKREDGIARASWEIDLHVADDGPPSPRTLQSKSAEYLAFSRRLYDGEWFDIPFGCLVTAGVDNLLVAGRCISAEILAHASLRIQQTCMSTGEAAGVIAALSLDGNCHPRHVQPTRVITQLAIDRSAYAPFVPMESGGARDAASAPYTKTRNGCHDDQ